jgi:hypothetical protein
MLSLTLTLSLFAVAQATAADFDIFAKEGFYKEVKAPEQTFVGVLRKADRGKDVVGFGRFNPFKLEMEGNKTREVYMGGKLKMLDPYVGKKVKIVGKPVDMEVEGRMHHEIWPASLEVLPQDKKEGGKVSELKIRAKTPARLAQGPVVIKSAEQLGKLQNMDADKASAAAAKMLKVDAIDWTKQMLIVISGGTQRTGGYSVEAKSLEVKDGKLIVNWKLNTPGPGSIVTQALTNPALTILVDRFEGDVIFEPKSPPPGAGKKLGN